MTTSDVIATFALVISGLAALYARWGAVQAKRANDLSIHVHKIAIYEEVVSFSDCFRGLFTVPTAQRLEKFRKNAVQRSEIYLTGEISDQLSEIYNHCSESEVWLSISEKDQGESNELPTELVVRSEYKSVLNLLRPVIQQIKDEIKLSDA